MRFKRKSLIVIVLIVLMFVPSLQTLGALTIVSYNANGGKIDGNAEKTYIRSNITDAIPTYDSNIFEFKGWSLTKIEGVLSIQKASVKKNLELYNAGDAIPAGAKTLYAVWDTQAIDLSKEFTVKQHFIDIETNLEFRAPETYTITAGSCVHQVQPPYKASDGQNYNVVEWEAHVGIANGPVVQLPDYIPSADCDLYTYFRKGEPAYEELKANDIQKSGIMKIKYDAVLATSGYMADDTFNYRYSYKDGREPEANWVFTVQECGYEREGYTFTGWKYDFVDADGNETVKYYQPGDTIVLGTTDIILYYAAGFKLNDTKVDGSPVTVYGSRYKYIDEDGNLLKTEYSWTDGKGVFHKTETEPAGAVYLYEDDVTVCWKREFLSEMILDAQWTADPYVLTYDYNFTYGDQRFPLGNTKGAYGMTLTDLRSFYVSPIKTITLSHDQRIIGAGDTIGTMPEPKRIGYVFRNWSWYESSDGNGKNLPVTAEDEYIFRGDRTLHARWEPADVKITLDYNGARSNTETVRKFLAVYGNLPTPKREGYDFKGWHYDTEDGTEVKADDIVSNPYPHTLVAKWTPKKVKVVYMTFGGTAVPDAEVEFGGTLGDAARAQTIKTGWVFDGWYTKPNGLGVKVTRDYPVDTLSTIVLYANYHGHRYTVTLDYCTEYKRTAVDFQKNGNDTYQVEYGSKYPTLPIPTREGYTFIGWATKKGADGNGQADGIVGGVDMGSFVQLGNRVLLDVTEARNHTLYAVWEAHKVKIIFDDNMNYKSPMDHEQY